MPQRDSLSTVTARLGARFWATNKRFDWAIDAFRHHFEFTRFYFEQNVLVDVWPRMNGGTRKEAEKKRACIDAENAARIKRGDEPIGYISFVRGSTVPDSAFNDALAGKTMDLIEPMGEGMLV
jgi:hypothetical protein